VLQSRPDLARRFFAPAVRPFIAGGGLIVVGLAMFAGLLDGVLERSDLSVWDSPTLTWLLTHRTPAATAVFARISWFADPPVLAAVVLVIVIALAWRTRRTRGGLLLGSAMGLALATSATIKVLVARSRPPVAEMVAPAELDFAFPSGHTLGTAVFLLVCAYLWWTRRRTARRALAGLAVSALGTFAVGASRLYLGYHWFTDVTASMALAVAILGVVIIGDRLLTDRALRRPFGSRLSPATATPMAT